jgi:hypothetical protein
MEKNEWMVLFRMAKQASTWMDRDNEEEPELELEHMNSRYFFEWTV